MVELTSVIGPKLPRLRSTYELFVAADPGVTKNDPLWHAVVLARMMVDDLKLGHTRELERAIGWKRRRFNPVSAIVPRSPKAARRLPAH